MAFPYISFLLLSLAFPCITLAADMTLINNVCGRAKNHAACFDEFKNDPRTVWADLAGLGGIGIDIAQDKARETFKFVDSLMKQATDPKLKAEYTVCWNNYIHAINSLDLSRNLLKGGKFGQITAQMSVALNVIFACGNAIEGPPAGSPQLKQANQKFEDFCDVISVISSLLG